MNNISNRSALENGALWLDQLRALNRSPKTITTYNAALISLERFLSHRGITGARQIRRHHLEAWQRSLSDSDLTIATVNSFTRIVRYWFQWQCEEGLIFSNPATCLQVPRVPFKLPRCPTHAEVTQVLRCTSGSDPVLVRDRALLELAYASGARLTEVVGLDVASLHLSRKLVRLFGKGARERVVPLTRFAVRTLTRYLKGARRQLLDGAPDHGALFIGVRGGMRLDAPGVADVFARAARRAKLEKLTPHDFRRAFATQLIANDAHPAAVSDMLGHRDGYRHLASYVHPKHLGKLGGRAVG